MYFLKQRTGPLLATGIDTHKGHQPKFRYRDRTSMTYIFPKLPPSSPNIIFEHHRIFRWCLYTLKILDPIPLFFTCWFANQPHLLSYLILLTVLRAFPWNEAIPKEKSPSNNHWDRCILGSAVLHCCINTVTSQKKVDIIMFFPLFEPKFSMPAVLHIFPYYFFSCRNQNKHTKKTHNGPGPAWDSTTREAPP